MNLRRRDTARHPGLHALRLVLFAASAFAASSAFAAVDWSAAKEQPIELFHPGQGSWEWVMTQADHSGAGKFREGKNCRGCHDGEQRDIGNAILAGGHKLEPAPVAGRAGGVTLYVRSARDAERLYFQFRWKPSPATGKKSSEDAAHITVMLDDGGTKESSRAGCWAACHDNAAGMASAPAGATTTKYLGASRVKLSRQGGADVKPAADLAALLGQNVFLEYWQARLNPGKPAVAASGYVLDKRHAHASTAVQATAEFVGGEWRVTLSRPLKASGPGQKDLVAGKTYAVGFALHDDYTDHRFHYVSLEYALQLDAAKATFVGGK